MAIVLALGAAAFYGSSDFMGAVVSRRHAVLAVAFGAQLAGLLTLAVVIPFLGHASVGPNDLLAGAAAGVFGGVGLLAVYRCLARGPMSVVAPTTALSASAVPVVAGIALGERPGPTAFLGIAVAFVAVALITREAPVPGEIRPRLDLGLLAPSLAAGGILGLFFVFLGGASPDAGLFPLLAARVTSVAILGGLMAAQRTALVREPRHLGIVLLSGVLDMTANVLFLLASHSGMLAVVAAITGLYPASTILLAQQRLDERLSPVQVAGLGTAAVAAVLVAIT